MTDQGALAGDDGFLDDLFDAASERIAAGGTVEPRDLVGDRTDLFGKAAEMIRLAREFAIVSPCGLPEVRGYELRHELGSGSSGTVYLAGQTGLGGRPVALKVLQAHAASDTRLRRRFLHEARTLAQFRHPHLVPVFDVVDAEGVCAFAMEWIDGRTLADLIAAVRDAQEPSRIELLAQRLGSAAGEFRFETTLHFFCRALVGVARGLAAVHDEGLLHRDVKPSNILVRRDGTALLSDFGLVRDPEHSLHTQTGMFVGTPAYASPEHLRGDAPLDARGDLFSLGATLYECITLRRPFGTGSGVEALKQRESGAFPAPRKLNARIPRDLEVIVSKALDPEPARRYSSADAFADDLERFIAFRPIKARPIAPTTRMLRFARRNRLPLGASLATAMVIFVALYLFGRLGGEKRKPHGTVRFSNMTSELVVEVNDGSPTTPHWAPLPVSTKGEVDVDTGPAQLRVHQKNCFPYILPEREVKDREFFDAPYTALPIALHSFPVGPVINPALLVRRTDDVTSLLVEVMGQPKFVDPFTGHYDGKSDSRMGKTSEKWVLRPATKSGPALVGALLRLDDGTFDLRTQVGTDATTLWTDRIIAASACTTADLDGDGAREFAACLPDGKVSIISGATHVQHQLAVFAGFLPTAMTSCTGPDGGIAVLLLGTEAGTPRLIAVEAKPGGRVWRRDVAAGGESVMAVDRADGPPGVVLAGGSGCRLVDPWSDAADRVLDPAPYAAATVLNRPPPNGKGIVVVSADQLALFDAAGRSLRSISVNTPVERMVAPLHVAAGNVDGLPGDEIVVGSADGFVRAFSGTTLEALWTFETLGAIKFPPLVEDVDGDGLADVVVLSADGQVHLLAGSDRFRRWIAKVGWPVGGKPAFVRLADGKGVVIAAGAERGERPFEIGMPGPWIRAFDAKTGAPRWPEPRRARVAFLVSPDVADLDGDGVEEALAQDRDGTLVSFRVSDGEPCLRLELHADDAFNGPPPRVVDVEGRREIVACVTEIKNGARHARIDAFDPRSREKLWSTSNGLPARVRSMESGVLGADGRMKIVCGTDGAGVVLLDAARGDIVRTVAEEETIHPGVLLADVTGDGVSDLIFGVYHPHSSVVVVDGRTFSTVWRRPLSVGGIDAKPAVGDLRGDGELEVVVADYDDVVTAFHGKSGDTFWTRQLPQCSGIYSTPVIADLDGDGRSDVVVGVKANQRHMTAILNGSDGNVKRRIGFEAEVLGTALIADLDGDGKPTIVIGAENGQLHAIPGRLR